MAALFTEVSAFTVFLAIAGAGFLFLVVSLFFSGVFEHLEGAFDHSFEHDLGHGGPGIFSTRVLSVFVTTFGGFGAIGTYYGLSVLAASGVGFTSGVAMAWLVYAFARFLYGQQASSEVRVQDLVGASARVTIGIPKGGMGQVRCRIGEELVDKIARSSDGEPVTENALVKIEDVLGEVVIVRKDI